MRDVIILTSFREAAKMESVERVSAARWAPPFAADWKVAQWMRPLDPSGKAVLLRDFLPDPLVGYKAFMLDLYRDRYPAVKAWVEGSMYYDRIAVACWCPYTRKAAEQMERYSSFHCHLGVVSDVLTAMEVEWEFGPVHEAAMVRG